MQASFPWENISAYWNVIEACVTWQGTKDFFNSAFFTSGAGALAGAWAGAKAAQKIAKSDKRRDELKTKIQDTNAALAIGFSMVNSFLSLKRQHVKGMVDRYSKERQSFLEAKLQRDTGFSQGNKTYHFKADFQSLEPMTAPTEQLFQLLLTKLSLSNRPLALGLQLTAALERLNGMIRSRNELVQKFHRGDLPSGASLHDMYFGLPFGDKSVSEEYSSALYGIASYLDDLIFFTRLLCEDLAEHGDALIDLYKKDVSKNAPTLSRLTFDTPESSGLFPAEEKYRSILSAFQRRPKARTSWQKLHENLLFWRRSSDPLSTSAVRSSVAQQTPPP